MNTILKTALVGTGKQPGVSLEEFPEIESLLSGVGSEQAADRLLLAAGALAVYEQAGALPADNIPLMAATQSSDRLLRSPRLVPLLHQVLQSDTHELLLEFLNAMQQQQLHLPYELLPMALNQTDGVVRRKIMPVLGERGRWLSKLNPHWNWVTQGTDALTKQDSAALRRAWEEGKLPQRAVALSVIRQTDSAEGRRWFEESLPQERADARAQLLEQFQHGLNTDDEPLLERLLDDRSEQVKQVAASLLSQLPDSAYVLRMTSRANTLLILQQGRLVAVPPEELPQDWQRDGISSKAPPGKGKRAWWVEQVISAVPLSHWTKRLGMTAANLLSVLETNDYAEDIALGWTRAIQNWQIESAARLEWAYALWSHWMLQWQREKKHRADLLNRLVVILRILPSGTAEQKLLPFLVMGRLDVDALLLLLDVLPRPWSTGFAQQYLKVARETVRTAVIDQAYEWGKTLSMAAGGIPYAMMNEAMAKWEVERPGEKSWTAKALIQQVERFVETIQIRKLFIDELKANDR